MEAALKIINEMLKMTELNEDIDEQKVLYLVDIIKDDCSDYSIMLKDTIITTFAGKPVKPKTLGPVSYTHLDVYKRQITDRKGMAYIKGYIYFKTL